MKKYLFLLLILLTACSKQVDECQLFQYPPVNLENVSYIIPMGSVSGEHVAPIDHQYYIAKDYFEQNISIPVYAPASGIVLDIQHMGSFRGETDMVFDDYRLIIEHKCGLESVFIHIDELSPRIKEVAPLFGEYNKVHLEVKAGEIIGYYRGSVDYNVVDNNIEITLINPASYSGFAQRIHIQDPFLYFNNVTKEQLIKKSLRTEKPEGGYIDDTPNTVIGTWFKENTNGWSGLNPYRYWADHLAIIYHHIDTDHIIISIGTYEGKAQQFGVKGNSPDIARINKFSGITKYELVHHDYFLDNMPWDRITFSQNLDVWNSPYVQGVILLEMLDERKLKVEILPNMAASNITTFSDNVEIYVR